MSIFCFTNTRVYHSSGHPQKWDFFGIVFLMLIFFEKRIRIPLKFIWRIVLYYSRPEFEEEVDLELTWRKHKTSAKKKHLSPIESFL